MLPHSMRVSGYLDKRLMNLNSDYSSPPGSLGCSISSRQANSLPPVQKPNSGRGRFGTCTGWRRSHYSSANKSESIELCLFQSASDKTTAFAGLWVRLWTVPGRALGPATTARVWTAILKKSVRRLVRLTSGQATRA